MFKDRVTGAMYVGGAVDLYNRATSYFMPSILASDKRRVYRYFANYGYEHMDLTLFVMPINTPFTEVIALEQHFIDMLEPDLNVDLVAGGMSGYHTPMSEVEKRIIRKKRGTAFFLYDTVVNGLVYTFDAKQQAYNNIKIHHKTLDEHLDTEKLYLARFMFSTTKLSEYPLEVLLSLEEIGLLINSIREAYKPKQPAAKTISAENVIHPGLSKQYNSISEFARAIKGDRQVIREYVNGVRPIGSLYRKQ